ncbi:MAG TPA: hypothetical protein DCQ66_03375 [Gammaproteobacteria bacterium]|nr:hypothetical protein [Gammaproteobacteria bacterium]
MNSERAPDFEKITDVKARKKAFFEYLLPEVKRQNSDIIELRNRIKSELLSDNKMTALKKYYKFKDDASIEDLLSSVDIVPTSLVLAQAAYESSWGRSRFAKHYHNYFGLWCFKKGCGVVPLRRDKKATHEVANLASLSKGIAYYMRSINRNSAYETLRKIRKHKRDTQQPITGVGLAEGLENYAEIGYDYVETVQSIIKYNKLEQYDYQI